MTLVVRLLFSVSHLTPLAAVVVPTVPTAQMGNGLLVRLLVHTNVHNYIQFKAVDGSYVVKAGKTYKARRRQKNRTQQNRRGRLLPAAFASMLTFTTVYVCVCVCDCIYVRDSVSAYRLTTSTTDVCV